MRFIWKPTGFEAVQWMGALTQEIVDFLELRNDTIGAMSDPPRIGGLVVYKYEGKPVMDKLYLWEERGRRYSVVGRTDWIVREIFPYGFYQASDAFLKSMAEPL